MRCGSSLQTVPTEQNNDESMGQARDKQSPPSGIILSRAFPWLEFNLRNRRLGCSGGPQQTSLQCPSVGSHKVTGDEQRAGSSGLGHASLAPAEMTTGLPAQPRLTEKHSCAVVHPGLPSI